MATMVAERDGGAAKTQLNQAFGRHFIGRKILSKGQICQKTTAFAGLAGWRGRHPARAAAVARRGWARVVALGASAVCNSRRRGP